MDSKHASSLAAVQAEARRFYKAGEYIKLFDLLDATQLPDFDQQAYLQALRAMYMAKVGDLYRSVAIFKDVLAMHTSDTTRVCALLGLMFAHNRTGEHKQEWLRFTEAMAMLDATSNEFAQSYLGRVKLHGGQAAAALGRLETAHDLLTDALAAFSPEVHQRVANEDWCLVGRSYAERALVNLARKQLEPAAEDASLALKHLNRVAEADGDLGEYRSWGLLAQGAVLQSRGQCPEAQPLLSEALASSDMRCRNLAARWLGV